MHSFHSIFSEDLLYTLERKTGISRDCILMYADDLLIICSDHSKLKLAIEIIKDWSSNNSMILNNNKSGIIEFRPRRSKPSKIFQVKNGVNSFCGIPIVSQYKYLGLTLNPTLQPMQQINSISRKAREIYARICPFLFSAEADTRKNLWQIFILPQIEFVLLFLANENTQYLRKKINQVIFGTFKLFMGLSKNTPNKVTNLLINYDFVQRAYYTQTLSRLKWEARCFSNPLLLPNFRIRKEDNSLSRTPQEFITYTNLFNSYCSRCHCINSFSHLKNFHGFRGPSVEDVLSLIKSFRNKKGNRKFTLNHLKKIIVPLVNVLKSTVVSTRSL